LADYWVAAGSIGTLAAAIIAYVQYRHIRKSAKTTGVETAILSSEPPVLKYSVIDGSGRYAFPDNWQVSLPDPLWVTHQKMADDLSRINFAFITLKNDNSHHLERICLELGAKSLWSFRVESVSSLAESAVILRATEEALEIKIDEMPAGEKAVISVLTGRWIGAIVRSKNSAVKLQPIRD
jgi:hypothetical protein